MEVKIFDLTLHIDVLELSDAKLGAEVRRRLIAARDESAARIKAGHMKARVRLGESITIEGVTYPSRKAAKRALGMSHEKFQKLYPRTLPADSKDS